MEPLTSGSKRHTWKGSCPCLGPRAGPEEQFAGGAVGPTTLLSNPRVQKMLPGSASDLPAAFGFANCSHCQKCPLPS